MTEHLIALATPEMDLPAARTDCVKVPSKVTPCNPLFILVCKSLAPVIDAFDPASSEKKKDLPKPVMAKKLKAMGARMNIIVTEVKGPEKPKAVAFKGEVTRNSKPVAASFSLFPFSFPNRLAVSLLDRSISVDD